MADGGGLFEYTMLVDPDAKAVIEAAVQGLSAPRPAEGEPDLRPSGQRRMDALLEVVRRGVASADGVPTTPKAELYVTVALDDLVARVNAATVFGSGEAGTLLAPETVRRIACDAGIIPVVLGKDGQVLDLGRRFRHFTSAQARALWLRDGACTFPDCTVPASWCDGHHLWHWADGGPTNLDNAALLCGRHHTIVHKKGYHAQLHDGRVEWDLHRRRLRPLAHPTPRHRGRPARGTSPGHTRDPDRRPSDSQRPSGLADLRRDGPVPEHHHGSAAAPVATMTPPCEPPRVARSAVIHSAVHRPVLLKPVVGRRRWRLPS